MSSSWFEERRADRAAESAERRRDEEHRAEMHRRERQKDREEKRQEKAQRRREKAQRKQARAARREKQLTPGNVYRKGTLALVALSALASLPAQILHFVGIHWMLFPVGPSLEGAAWVMFAGVAYADERKLPVWVRWLLRALSLSAAGFAAHINYQYGLSLTGHGVSADNAQAAGLGLAAVTLGGPLFFEVRQWVMTLTASTATPKQQAEDRARQRHDKRRKRDHKDVVDLAKRLVSAAPYGQLKFEDAFAKAWLILKGTPDLGMAPELHTAAVESALAFDEARRMPQPSEKQVRDRLAVHLGSPAFIFPTSPETAWKGIEKKDKKLQVASQIPPVLEEAAKRRRNGGRKRPVPPIRRKGDSLPFHPMAKVAAADTARKVPAVNGHHH
ncbi:hypothetical protein [Streptomyces smyrnaeus]|uniref:hypothetical protein n=1 Tax=Streptomyces smyrnaeus TaxID=1387713 RepID=UPI0033CFF686